MTKINKQVCISKILVICSCGKKIEHSHYSSKKEEGKTGHGEPMTFPKKNISKKFKK